MASHLLVLALITPRRSPASSDESNLSVDAEQQRSSIRETNTRIGMLLNPPHHNSLNTSNFLPTPIPINRSVVVNVSAASADAQSQSPIRACKNRAASFIQSSFGPSPCRGAKSKQRRVDEIDDSNADDTIMEQWQQIFLSEGFGFHGKPSTEFMGWRRLTHFSCFPYPQLAQ
jgi:hypothetical protein